MKNRYSNPFNIRSRVGLPRFIIQPVYVPVDDELYNMTRIKKQCNPNESNDTITPEITYPETPIIDDNNSELVLPENNEPPKVDDDLLEPIEPIDVVEPIEPIDVVEPVEPIDIVPVLPNDVNEPLYPIDNEPPKVDDDPLPTEPETPIQKDDFSDPIVSEDPLLDAVISEDNFDLIQPEEPLNQVDQINPIETIETVISQEPENSVEPISEPEIPKIDDDPLPLDPIEPEITVNQEVTEVEYPSIDQPENQVDIEPPKVDDDPLFVEEPSVPTEPGYPNIEEDPIYVEPAPNDDQNNESNDSESRITSVASEIPKENYPIIADPETPVESTCSKKLEKIADECECADEVEKEIRDRLYKIKMQEQDIQSRIAQIKNDESEIKNLQGAISDNLETLENKE
jgi:hypothetical protein